jgi:cystathionine gamma-lyase
MENEQKNAIMDYIEKHDKKYEKCGFSTKCCHIGQEPDYVTGAVNPAIQLSSTFAQHEPGVPYGPYDYSRAGNPTRSNLERLIAGLESAKYSLIWSSGMATMMGIIHMLKTGDEVICIEDVYGGTQRYFKKISSIQQGINFKFMSFDDLDEVKKTFNEKTKMIWLESPTNPTLKTVDLEELVKITRNYRDDILIVVDNTFMSPYNCRPIEYGVDIVVESATKYIGGHSDLIMGMTSTNSKEIQDKLYFIHKSIGAVPAPFDCYMAIRGIKTLSLRMERQNSNSMKIAKYLETQSHVEKVFYPGLESSPYHKIAKKQQKGFGGIVSFVLKGDLDQTKKFISSLKIFTLAESLGSVESLVNHPGLMTHMSVPEDVRKYLGIGDGFIRLAIGIEEIDDLIEDLENGFKGLENN